LIAEKAGDRARIDAGKARNIIPRAPRVEGLYRCVMRKLFGHVGNNDRSALDARRLKNNTYIMRVARSYIKRNTIIADEGCGEDEDLSTIRRIGHGLSIWDC